MAQKHTIEQLKWRKHLLEERTDRENYNIIKKIDRGIARLAREKKHQGISKPIPVDIDFNHSVEEKSIHLNSIKPEENTVFIMTIDPKSLCSLAMENWYKNYNEKEN